MQSPRWTASDNLSMQYAVQGEQPWTLEERKAIRDAVIEFGEQDWVSVVNAMCKYGRSADECRLHWKLTYPLVKVRVVLLAAQQWLASHVPIHLCCR